jgi:hypothetical protein
MLSASLQDAIPETETETKKRQKYVPPIPTELLREWITVRNKKRAVDITELVWSGLVREANKLGWTPEKAVTYCCERGWVSLDASWVETPKNVKTSYTPKGNLI